VIGWLVARWCRDEHFCRPLTLFAHLGRTLPSGSPPCPVRFGHISFSDLEPKIKDQAAKICHLQVFAVVLLVDSVRNIAHSVCRIYCAYLSATQSFLLMSFEDQMKKLREKIVACESDEEVMELARELRELIHQRLEEVRGPIKLSLRR